MEEIIILLQQEKEQIAISFKKMERGKLVITN